MPQVSAEVVVPVSPTAAFDALSSFGDLWWVPGTARVDVSGSGVGAMRVVTTVDGAQIKERLVSFDADARSYSYTILEAPMPIRDYLSTLEVHAEGSGARVRWSATFDANEAIQAAMQGLYDAAMNGLRERFG